MMNVAVTAFALGLCLAIAVGGDEARRVHEETQRLLADRSKQTDRTVRWQVIPASVAQAVVEEHLGGVTRRGNCLVNSSFEVGMEGWAANPILTGRGLDDKTAYHGKWSLRLSHAYRWFAGPETFYYPIKAGRPYTVSLWAKSDGDGACLSVGVWSGWTDQDANHLARPGVSQEFPVGRNWQRCSFSFVPLEHPKSSLTIVLGEPAYAKPPENEGRTVWVDALQLEEGGLTDYAPSAPAKLSCLVGRQSRPLDFFLGENDAVPVHTKVADYGGSARTAQLDYQVLDYSGTVVRRLKRSLVIRDGAGSDEFRLRGLDFGYYQVIAQLGGKPSVRSFQRAFAVVPAAVGTDRNTDVPWGSHIIYPVANELPELKRAGIRWLRTWGSGSAQMRATAWRDVEPERGRFVFDDEAIDEPRRLGFEILATLDWPPEWALTVPKEEFWYRHRLTDWENYVRATATHYRGRIRYWEVKNEPYPWTEPEVKPAAAAYAAILKATARIIKAVDQRNVVVGLCTHPTDLAPPVMHWTEEVLKLTGTGLFDILSFHSYINAPEPEGVAWSQTRRVTALRDLMRKYGGEKPLWDTEWAVWGSGYTDRHPGGWGVYNRHLTAGGWPGEGRDGRWAARHLTTLYVSGLANNVRKFFYFGDTRPEPYALYALTGQGNYEYDGAPKPKTVAEATLARFLPTAKFSKQAPVGDKARCYVFDTPKGPLAVYWGLRMGETRESVSVRLPASQLAAYSLVGTRLSLTPGTGRDQTIVPLSSDPVYLFGVGMSCDHLATALAEAIGGGE